MSGAAYSPDISNIGPGYGGGFGFGGYGGGFEGLLFGLLIANNGLFGRDKDDSCCPRPNIAELISATDRDVLQGTAATLSAVDNSKADLLQFLCCKFGEVEQNQAQARFENAQQTTEILQAISNQTKERLQDELSQARAKNHHHDIMIQVQSQYMGGYRPGVAPTVAPTAS